MINQLSAAAVRFLEGRGLDVELAVNLGLSSEQAAGGGEVLVFPFVRRGQVINHKRRVLPKGKFWQDTGAPKAAWNEDCLLDNSLLSQAVIITEGELDAVAAIQSGLLRTISVPDGAPPPGERTEEQLRGSLKYAWLDPIRPLLGKDRAPEIIIAADGDDNGGALLTDLALQLGRFRCKYLTYPLAKDPEKRGRPRLKDLNEVLEDYGVPGVRKTIAQAKFLRAEGLYRMSEVPELPEPPVWRIDEEFRLLGENMAFRPGDVSVGTGIPSYGKSTFATNVWGALAKRYGVISVWASMEQRTKPDFRRNLRNWFLETKEPASAADLARADAWIEHHHRFIQAPEDQDMTLQRVLDLAQMAAIQEGANALIIDPWNELEHFRDRHISLTEYVSESLREIRRFARAFNMHVMILAHPTKAVKGENGAYRCPNMYDISDSSAWYNKADVGFIVHRPNPDETLISVEKSRYHDILGKPGQAYLHYERERGHYREIGRDSMWSESQ